MHFYHFPHIFDPPFLFLRRIRHRRSHPALRPHVPQSAPQTPPSDAHPLQRLHPEAVHRQSQRCLQTGPADQRLHGRARLPQVSSRDEDRARRRAHTQGHPQAGHGDPVPLEPDPALCGRRGTGTNGPGDRRVAFCHRGGTVLLREAAELKGRVLANRLRTGPGLSAPVFGHDGRWAAYDLEFVDSVCAGAES